MQFNKIHDKILHYVQNDHMRGLSVAVVRGGQLLGRAAAGQSDEACAAGAVNVHSRFLVASLTKPVTAAAVMRLVEEGELTLTTRATAVLPRFNGDGKEQIELWHLLSHTSGLPNMVPEHVQLRAAHATLDEFFDGVCRTPLLFAPGTRVGYQSIGSLVMAKMAEKVSGLPFAQFVRQQILLPAGMHDARLGLPGDEHMENDVRVQLPPEQRGTNWNWNTEYSRRIGSPWGGLTATATDMASFVQLFLLHGRSVTGETVLSPATVDIMLRNWLNPVDGSWPAWGLGWKLKGHGLSPAAPTSTLGGSSAERPIYVIPSWQMTAGTGFMGDLVSPEAFGHSGATGCAMWGDPRSGLAVAMLSSSPVALRNGTLTKLANVIATAML